MDVRIGVRQSAKEVVVELADSVDRDELKNKVSSALTDGSKVLWLIDRKGRDVAVPVDGIAYVEIGAGSDRPIGFGS